MEKRLGMFIHFGPVKLRGTEIGWSHNHEVAEDDYHGQTSRLAPAGVWTVMLRDGGRRKATRLELKNIWMPFIPSVIVRREM